MWKEISYLDYREIISHANVNFKHIAGACLWFKDGKIIAKAQGPDSYYMWVDRDPDCCMGTEKAEVYTPALADWVGYKVKS